MWVKTDLNYVFLVTIIYLRFFFMWWWSILPQCTTKSRHSKDDVERKRFERNSKKKKKQRESDGKRMIQRLNEENGRHENTVLSTWRWCKQGWPCLSQTTDRRPGLRSLLLTLLNKYLFNLINHYPTVISNKKTNFSLLKLLDRERSLPE